MRRETDNGPDGNAPEGRAREEAHDPYRAVTDAIVAAIEAGAAGWRMPWHGPAAFATGEWATYRQWAQLGAQVRRGERGAPVVFWRVVEAEPEPPAGDRDTEAAGAESPKGRRARILARLWHVFNADQVDGWRPSTPARPSEADAVEAAERLVQGTGADIRVGGVRACYEPGPDVIRMPERRLFFGSATGTATEAYYSTLFHELVHWTGHPLRLRRDLTGRFGSASYAMEELVAELGAAFLCADLGMSDEPRADHAAYVADWLKALRDDRYAVFRAATDAARAAEFVSRLR